MHRLVSYWLCGVLALSACERAEPEAHASNAPPAAPTAATGDGMCKEHGVLEAVCTKCNPALVAVFKAKGDFCEEHGFPESFCPICHPERGGKPAADVKDDGSPPDGVRVHFKTKDTAELAGIEVAKVTRKAGASELPVTAHLVYDATKVAQVNARAPGVVRTIKVDIGARVEVGAPLAIIESASFGADQSRLQAERSRLEVAEASYARAVGLRAEGIVPEKSVLAAKQELDAARAGVAGVQAALGVVGGAGSGSRYTLTAPLAGVVTQRGAAIGRVVDTQEVLFEIVDTSTMWAELDIPEGALTRVLVGHQVSVAVEGLPNEAFVGTLQYVAPLVDPRTRTAVGRVPLDNPAGLLRGNMFARARVAVQGDDAALFVPRDAVQRAKSVDLVFVRIAADTFEGRRVELGPADESAIQVKGRLKEGDEVATTGSFLLKTETIKGSIGAGCCEAEGP